MTRPAGRRPAGRRPAGRRPAGRRPIQVTVRSNDDGPTHISAPFLIFILGPTDEELTCLMFVVFYGLAVCLSV